MRTTRSPLATAVFIVSLLAACSGAATAPGNSLRGTSDSAALTTRALSPTTVPPTTTRESPAAMTTVSPASTTSTQPADTTPPELAVTDPVDGSTVATDTYLFRGTTEPSAEVVAAGRYEAEVAADGTWSIVLVLNEGGNVATFTATDKAGNTTETSITVVYVPPTTTTAGPSQACADRPSMPIPADARYIDWAEPIHGDLDGDGYSDTITGYYFGDSPYALDSDWYLHVELASGWGTQLGRGDAASVSYEEFVRPIRVVTLSGHRLIEAEIGGTLVGGAYGFFAFEDCVLGRALTEDGEWPALWEGGGPLHDDRYTCQPDGVIMHEASNNDVDDSPETRIYLWSRRWYYRYSPPTLTLVEEITETLDPPLRYDDYWAMFTPCSDFAIP